MVDWDHTSGLGDGRLPPLVAVFVRRILGRARSSATSTARAFTLDPSFAETLRREPAVWLDQGRDDYAGVTWSNIPLEDGRRIFLGWMSNWDYAEEVPTRPSRGAMTLPRTLRLARTDVRYRVSPHRYES